MGAKYKRVLLKLSGEALAGDKKTGLNDAMLEKIALEIKKCADMGVQIAIVVGGGNFWRGRSSGNMDRTRADHIGMLATVMNALGVADALENVGLEAVVQSSIDMGPVAEGFVKNNAVRYLNEGKIVVFGGGTGNPFFSTDTTAALRAAEIGAEVILFAKNIDAVYTADPRVDKTAVKLDSITYMEVLNQGLGVMDTTAATLCMDNDILIHVFGLDDPENIVRAACGEKLGTIVSK